MFAWPTIRFSNVRFADINRKIWKIVYQYYRKNKKLVYALNYNNETVENKMDN